MAKKKPAPKKTAASSKKETAAETARLAALEAETFGADGDDEELDEGDEAPDSENEPSGDAPTGKRTPKETYQLRMRQMKPHQRVASKVVATIDRFRHIVDDVASWTNAGPLSASAKVAFKAIEEFRDALQKLPADFEAERPRKAASSGLVVGMKMNLREKHYAAYEGFIAPKDRKNLEVISIVKGRIGCKTASGEKVHIPRGHLEIAAGQPGAAKPKAA